MFKVIFFLKTMRGLLWGKLKCFVHIVYKLIFEAIFLVVLKINPFAKNKKDYFSINLN